MVTISLRCVSWLVKLPLPSLTRFVPSMGKLLFNLLKNYAKAGAKVGENFEMVLSAFKVRKYSCFLIKGTARSPLAPDFPFEDRARRWTNVN